MNKVAIYTDGACRGNGKAISDGGYGAVILAEEELKICGEKILQYRLFGCKKNTTNNEMEISAVISALDSLKNQHDLANIEITIHSDSAYIVNCMNDKWYKKWLNNGWRTSKGTKVENKHLWEKLLNMNELFKRVNYKKVKGHSDDLYNDMADELANMGIDYYLENEKLFVSKEIPYKIIEFNSSESLDVSF